MLRLPKAGAGDGIEALPKGTRWLKEGGALSFSVAQFQDLRKRAKYLIWRQKRTWRNW
jgi:hypothetical protein